MNDFTWFRIEYTREKEKELQALHLFKHIDDFVLCDVYKAADILQATAENHTSPYDIDIHGETEIHDRAAAAAYIKAHRGDYLFTGYNTGLDRVLCVEITEDIDTGTNKPTAILLDHPEHGFLWLEMIRSWTR